MSSELIQTFNLRQILPPITVNAWGGLGSQVFALIVARRICKTHTFRRVHIKFHSSGVTRRSIEIPSHKLSGISYSFIDDFVISESSTRGTPGAKTYSPFLFLKKMLKAVLSSIGLVSDFDESKRTTRLRPWIISIRGHYSNLKISDQEVNQAAEVFDLDIKSLIPHHNQIAIHYRLGDLLDLDSKTHIDPQVIGRILQGQKSSYSIVASYSDTPVEKLPTAILNFFEPYSVTFYSMDTLSTVKACASATIFIGTNSKISLWIAAFRICSLKKGVTYLPESLAIKLLYLVGTENLYENLIAY